jgi:hypothetical protein
MLHAPGVHHQSHDDVSLTFVPRMRAEEGSGS